MSRGRGGKIKFQALLDLEDMRKSLGTIEKAVGQTGTKLSKTGKMAKAAFGAAAASGIAAAGVELFNHGAQLQALEGRYKTVFQGVTRELDRWIDDQNEKFGVSETVLKGMAASIGDLLVPLGMTREDAATTTQEVLTLSNALSEWSGGKFDAAEASDVLTKAVLGEYDSLKQLGVDLDANEVKTRAAAIAGGELEGAALKEAEALATLELITERSADAMSKYEAGGDKAVRVSKRLEARLADLKDKFAEATTAATPLVEVLVDLLPKGVTSGSTGEILDVISALKAAGLEVEEFARMVGGIDRASDPTVRQQLIEDAYRLADGIVFYRDEINRLMATGGYGQYLEDQVPVSEAAAARLNAIIAGIGDDSRAEFKLKVDGIVETWKGLPDSFEDTKFDINKAIRDVLAVSAAETKFAEDMETLADAGLDAVVTALANNPDRATAMVEAAALADDIAAAMRLEEAMEGTTSADQKAFLDKLAELRQDQEILSAAGQTGGEHARAYQKGWDARMGDWTPETPFTDDGLLDDIEEGLTRRQGDGGAVLQ